MQGASLLSQWKGMMSHSLGLGSLLRRFLSPRLRRDHHRSKALFAFALPLAHLMCYERFCIS